MQIGLGISIVAALNLSGSVSYAPILSNLNGVISVVTAGYPAPPTLTNSNGIVTAEAA